MLEAIWIELIQPHSKGILLGTFYHPPDGSDLLDAEFMSLFENVLEVANAEKKEVIIMGNLNCNFSPGSRCKVETKKLKNILQSMNMTHRLLMSLQESQGNLKPLSTLSVLLNRRILTQSRWSGQHSVIMT